MFNDVAFVIPVKIESSERQENLDIVYTYLEKISGASIKIFNTTESPFHRTRYINDLIKQVNTPIVGVWDTDAILPYNQIEAAIQAIRDGATLAYPFSGAFLNIPQHLKHASIETLQEQASTFESLSQNSDSVGGAYMINVAKYKECGLENEKFISWGCEDRERFSRVAILGHKIIQIPGTLFHLTHKRNPSNYFNNPTFNNNLQEQHRVEAMTKQELQKYIKTWSWLT